MYDLHTHSLFSDGVLVPSELVRRYQAYGYKGVCITDHMDESNLKSILPQIVEFCNSNRDAFPGIEIVPGCELTHVPVAAISDLVAQSRELGAKIVVVHGETIVEPVIEGTNRAAIDGGADVIAHAGLLKHEDAELAKEKSVAFEITSRSGHSYTNGHVVKVAKEVGATLVYSSDFHSPNNLLDENMVRLVLAGSGLSFEEVQLVLDNTKALFDKLK